jgi:DNA-binding NarL/FixJ family response regulator
MTTQPSKPNDSVRTELGPASALIEGLSTLTVREQQIVQLLTQGLTNKRIGQQLGIVEDTVKKHLQHIYDKLGVRRRALVILGKRE